VSIDEMGLRVHNSGPFSVESPKGGDNLVPGQPFTFEWNRNGSEAICDNLEIRLSYDLGLNFDVVLATGLDFDAGSATVDIPLNLLSSGAVYIMLACADNTCVQFFNISNGTVSIESVCQAQSAVICPSDSLITDEATPVLSMDLQAFRGAPIQSIRADNSSDGLIKYTVWNLDKTACTQLTVPRLTFLVHCQFLMPPLLTKMIFVLVLFLRVRR